MPSRTRKNKKNANRTRRIVNAIRRGFYRVQKNSVTKNLNVTNETELPTMDKLLMGGQTTFVLVYADWCGHCREYKPKWNHITNAPGRNANMVKVPAELQEKSTVLKNVPIEGIPTVLQVKNGVVKPMSLDDANDVNKMMLEVSRPANSRTENGVINSNTENTNMNNSTALLPTANLKKALNKINAPYNLAETDGSRLNQPALNLAVPAAIATNILSNLNEDNLNLSAPDNVENSTMNNAEETANVLNNLNKKQRGGGSLMGFLQRLGQPLHARGQTRRRRHRRKSSTRKN